MDSPARQGKGATATATDPARDLEIGFLADHLAACGVLAEWFTADWGEPGEPGAITARRRELPARANRDRLPLCLVGLLDGAPVATATLKFREIEYADADFWVGSVYVRTDRRGNGHCRTIVTAAEQLAAGLGFTPLYLYTRDKVALYCRLGWRTVAEAAVSGRPVTIMRRDPLGRPR